MFDWLKCKPIQSNQAIRDTLFGDAPLSKWGAISQSAMDAEPWVSFGRAKEALDRDDSQAAIETLKGILEMPELESRHYLQSWHFLRELGVHPTAEKEKQLLGVIVEVGMTTGVDLLVAYADHHARYYNYSGAGIVWERPKDSLDAAIDDLLRVGAVTIKAIGPWKESRPSAPPDGHVRINLLSPSGLHFGQGPHDDLAKDQSGGPVLASAFRLMQELMKLEKK